MSLDLSFAPSFTGFDQSSGSAYDAGVVNGTGPTTTAPPDASGGGGSFLSALLPTLTSGLSAVTAAEINKNLGAGLSSGLATVDANGNLTYSATPQPTPTAAQVVQSQALSSPVLLFGIIGAVLVLALVLKK